MFSLVFPSLQGDPITLWLGLCRQCPAAASQHPGVLASLQSQAHVHMAMARGATALASCYSVCVTVAGRVENDLRTVAGIGRCSVCSRLLGTVWVSHELWASSASLHRAMASGATWVGATSAGALSFPASTPPSLQQGDFSL